MVTRLRFYVDILEKRKKSKQREEKKKNKQETRKRKEDNMVEISWLITTPTFYFLQTEIGMCILGR